MSAHMATHCIGSYCIVLFCIVRPFSSIRLHSSMNKIKSKNSHHSWYRNNDREESAPVVQSESAKVDPHLDNDQIFAHPIFNPIGEQ